MAICNHPILCCTIKVPSYPRRSNTHPASMQVFIVSFPDPMYRRSCHASLQEQFSHHENDSSVSTRLLAFLVICFICCLPPLRKWPPLMVVVIYFVITCVAFTLEFNGVFHRACHLFHENQRDDFDLIVRRLGSRPLHILSNCISFTMGLKVSHESENSNQLMCNIISFLLLSYSFVSFFLHMLHFGVALVVSLSPCD